MNEASQSPGLIRVLITDDHPVMRHGLRAAVSVERDMDLVAEDVREGYVSSEVAREVYRVALDSRGQVDQEATRTLRRALKAPRNGASPDVAWDGQ